MNSKVLQEKIKEIESHEIEMRILKRTESGSQGEVVDHKGVCSTKSMVSLKHYDNVSHFINAFDLIFNIFF